MTRSSEALRPFAGARTRLDATWRLDEEGYLHTGTEGSFVESSRCRLTTGRMETQG